MVCMIRQEGKGTEVGPEKDRARPFWLEEEGEGREGHAHVLSTIIDDGI